jgi:hypothetical protein
MAEAGTEHNLVTTARSFYDRFVAKADIPEHNWRAAKKRA